MDCLPSQCLLGLLHTIAQATLITFRPRLPHSPLPLPPPAPSHPPEPDLPQPPGVGQLTPLPTTLPRCVGCQGCNAGWGGGVVGCRNLARA